MTTDLVPIQTLERMAQALANSKLFGVTNPEQALALMLVAQAEGLHPATAARDYHIIQGRPALKADAMLARYLASGGRVEWHEHTDQKVSATFTHPAGGSLKIDWDFARAKAAGLGSKDMWLKYPRQMLRARVISEGIRATNPGVATGMYTPEEVQDFADEPKRFAKAKDVTPAKEEDPAARASGPLSPADDAATAHQPAAAGPSAREQTLRSMCEQARVKYADLLAKADVQIVEDLSDADYAAAVAMLDRKIAKLAEKAA